MTATVRRGGTRTLGPRVTRITVAWIIPMPYREGATLTPGGARSTPIDGAMTRAGYFLRENSMAASSPADSDRAVPSFVRKAAAVLHDEFKGIASLGTEVIGATSPTGSLNFETASEQWRQQATSLADTISCRLRPRNSAAFGLLPPIVRLCRRSCAAHSCRRLLLSGSFAPREPLRSSNPKPRCERTRSSLFGAIHDLVRQ